MLTKLLFILFLSRFKTQIQKHNFSLTFFLLPKNHFTLLDPNLIICLFFFIDYTMATNSIAKTETKVIPEMVENHLMLVEVMVTEMELTKVRTQGKDAYGVVARGGDSHGKGDFMVMVSTESVKKEDP